MALAHRNRAWTLVLALCVACGQEAETDSSGEGSGSSASTDGTDESGTGEETGTAESETGESTTEGDVCDLSLLHSVQCGSPPTCGHFRTSSYMLGQPECVFAALAAGEPGFYSAEWCNDEFICDGRGVRLFRVRDDGSVADIVGGSWVDPETGTDDLCGYALGVEVCTLKPPEYFEMCAAGWDDFEIFAQCQPSDWFQSCGADSFQSCG